MGLAVLTNHNGLVYRFPSVKCIFVVVVIIIAFLSI